MDCDYRDTNRAGWDARTSVHLRSEFYDLEGFRGGKDTLCLPELTLVGDVRGKRMLHLQCHFGLDTLSWARRGAVPTGIDFSPAALAAARQLADETGISAEFLKADVQQLGDQFGCAFDVAISTYGVICWLWDLSGWASGIRSSLRPGGRFVLVEFHPALDPLFEGKVSGYPDYFMEPQANRRSTSGTYTDPSALIRYDEYRWQHPISEVITALIRTGLRLVTFEEYPYCSYPLLPSVLDEFRSGMWFSSSAPNRLPFMYALVLEAP